MGKERTLRKYLPVLIFILAFTSLLGGQIAFDLLDIKARPSPKKKSLLVHYRNVFSKLKLTTTKARELRPAKSSTPIVLLNFWASWCGPCLSEFPSIVKMKKHFGDNKVLVIGINGDDKDQLAQIERISQRYGLNFPHVADKNGSILNEFLITSIPTTVIFHKGQVLKVTNGEQDFNSTEFIGIFEKLLADK